jgi:ABC-type nitrate/sulfonate/bicarbonate transport system substrate-binding protein
MWHTMRGNALVLCTVGLLTACGGQAAPVPASAPPSAAASSAGKPASAAASGQPASRKAIVGMASLSASFSIPWVAEATGAYARHNVNVDMPFFNDTTVAFDSLALGQTDATLISASQVITSDVNGKFDLVFVASILNRAQFSLMVKDNIKTVADLKGKLLGTDKPYTAVDYGMRLALSLLGVKNSDVQLRVIGSSQQEFTALTSGQVDGALLSPPYTFQAEKLGFHSIQDTFDQPYQNVGLVMSRKRIDALLPAFVPYVEALRDGIKAYNEQPEVAVKAISTKTKETDPATLQKTYDFYKTTAPWEPSMQPTREGIQSMMDFLAGAFPEVKNTKVDDYVDNRILSRLS